MLCLARSARHRIAFSEVRTLTEETDALCHTVGVIARIRLLEFGDDLLYALRRAILGAVIHNDDLEFIDRIILIDAAVHRTLNPLLLLKTGDDDGHARRIVWIDAYGAIERRE